MSERLSLPDSLSASEWIAELSVFGAEHGYYTPLGKKHSALYTAKSEKVLLVTFESMAHIRMSSPNGVPIGFDFAEARGWSHLSLIARQETWFRNPHVWRFFDRQIDSGFFEEFEKVIFYGSGMGGYAAAAFSVAAPGATVIAVSPQATLSPERAGWDTRFGPNRARDFSSRFGYAPDMVEAANDVYIVYDPSETEDAMHASLFHGGHINRIKYRRGGPASIDADLRDIGILDAVFDAISGQTLSPATFHRALRARKQHTPWLRANLGRVIGTERPYLTGLFARAALEVQDVPRFKKILDGAVDKLALEGRSLPLQASARREKTGS